MKDAEDSKFILLNLSQPCPSGSQSFFFKSATPKKLKKSSIKATQYTTGTSSPPILFWTSRWTSHFWSSHKCTVQRPTTLWMVVFKCSYDFCEVSFYCLSSHGSFNVRSQQVISIFVPRWRGLCLPQEIAHLYKSKLELNVPQRFFFFFLPSEFVFFLRREAFSSLFNITD